MCITEIIGWMFLGAGVEMAILIAIALWDDQKKKKGR